MSVKVPGRFQEHPIMKRAEIVGIIYNSRVPEAQAMTLALMKRLDEIHRLSQVLRREIVQKNRIWSVREHHQKLP